MGGREGAPPTEFPARMGEVAPREPAAHGCTRYDRLIRVTAKDLLTTHGMGPEAIRIPEEEPTARGPSFAADRVRGRGRRGRCGNRGAWVVRDTVTSMNNTPTRPSTSVEDYVKVIYDLQERGTGPVTISGMAERLSVSNSSVSGMLRKLGELGLVDHRRYGSVRLTEEGTKAALSVLRRHRLLETYLVAALGYSWDEVHDEAEILEHVVSDKFVDRIASYLGDPVVDPHGDPIPTTDGRVVERPSVLLSEADEGVEGTIVRVNDTDPDLLRYLADIEIGIGMTVRVVERQPFAGSLRIAVRADADARDRDRSLGLVAAEALWIAPDES